MNKIAELSGNIHDAGYCNTLRKRARKVTNGAPSCATFLSLVLLDIGMIDEVRTWTSDIVGNVDGPGRIEREQNITRVMRPRDVRALDIIVTMDLNNNKAPDHVGFALTAAQGKDLGNPFVKFCDNQGLYWRNLGKSGWYKGKYVAKTPMAYALRIDAAPFTDEALTAQRQALVNMLPAIYEIADAPDVLSEETRGLLNRFRFSPELRNLKPKE